ncbi:VWA domain containing CoxE-like protein [Stieleria neptunia]|uniref:VWA domain containing CoxE-like protein n=1 Tax=Stieleria neptunia TaxID=2527979 RepID=A0A518HZD8_9BACT|nr:VWA domain-containing protein [Stieleria neptunia]QDV46210.1 VWA domain containing CoxE-like protein [Stieleria neptunia]
MRDLDLWMALGGGDSVPDLAIRIETLANAPLHRRVPYFARLLPFAHHADADVRSATLKAFSGCDGARTRREWVAALDDDSPDVVTAALGAVASAPCRSLLVHALFHRGLEVRKGAVPIAMGRVHQCRPQGNNADLPLFLLADAQCQRVVVEHLDNAQLDRVPLGLLIELHRAGQLDDVLARRLVLKSSADGLLVFLRDGLSDAGGADPGDDSDVRWLIDLFWETGDLNDNDYSSSRYPQGVIAFLRESVATKRALWMNKRFVLICQDIARQHGHWNLQIAQTCLLGMASEAAWMYESILPVDVFRASLQVFYASGLAREEIGESIVDQLLRLPCCRRPSGQLDLWVIGALLHLRRRDGFQRLLGVYKINQIAAGFDERPEESVRLFSYPGSTRERNELIEAVFARRSKDPLAVAVMMCALPADGLDFAGRLTAHDAVKTLHALSDLCTTHGWSISTNKSAAISHQLKQRFFAGATLHGEAFAGFLNQWLQGKWKGEGADGDVSVDMDHVMVRHCATFSIGVNVLTDVVRSMQNTSFVGWMLETLPSLTIARFLSLMPSCSGLSYALEMTLANALADHREPAIAQWAGDRIAIRDSGMSRNQALETLDPSSQMTPISDELAEQLRTAAPHRLESIVRPLGAGRRQGVAAALADRPDPVDHDERVWGCVALLCSGDGVDEVAAGVARFSVDQEHIINAAAAELASFGDLAKLGIFGLAVMFRWEAAAFAFGERSMQDDTECLAWLRLADDLPCKILSRDVIQCVARVLALWIARDRVRAIELLTETHLAAWLEQLQTPHGKPAAGVLMRAFKANLNRPAFVALRDRAAEILPNLSESLQFQLRSWVDATDLGSMAISARVQKVSSSPDVAQAIASCTDLDQLTQWLAERNSGIVSDAAVRLVELGRPGIERLVITLKQPTPVRCVSIIAETISLWPAETINVVQTLIDDEAGLPDSVRFLVALEALDAFGTETAEPQGIGVAPTLDLISQLLLRPCDQSWVHVLDMKRLLQWLSPTTKDSYASLWIDSPHPNVYRFAVAHQIANLNMLGDEETSNALAVEADLEKFLRHGTDRDSVYRVVASVALARRGNWVGFPILLAHRLSKAYGAPNDPLEQLPDTFCPDELVVETAQSLLMAGPKVIGESEIASVIDFYRSSENVVAAGNLVMREAMDENVRQSAARQMRSELHRQAKLRRIANVFQRGIRLGRELTGRLFSIEMIGGSDFGYTRLNEDRVYINPMPLLNGTANAEDIVEGLILHEFGHHLYHRGPQQQAVWEEADSIGMGRLLNLVSDEHLERNLRALDRSYGDQLKRLGAYAFNRSAKEFDVDYILELLGRHTAGVLQAHPPAVARNPACLRVRGGSLLQELERSGSSFSRFFRALRLGLGNRHNDPKVAEALALFDKGFRKLRMPQLLDICKRLHQIFGDEACMQRCLSADDLIADPDGDLIIKADGISNDDIQSEIHRIKRKPSESNDSGSGRRIRAINVGEDLHFDLLTQIRRLPFHPATYRPYSQQVAAASRRFRDFLRDLGLSRVRCPRRIRGRQVDAARLKDLVLKGDPRVLVAREQRYHNDLFLSVVVDCSGSMEFGDNLSKAQLFAAMMAEACRDLDGVDLRLFGFTDTEIYDAGDARRPAVAEFRAGGGNNDAAALWHASEVASQSKRSAKVVVMISDGLPTECSTEALKALVARLSRRGDLVCAQVAVQPLAEVCFSHYIELTDADTMVSVQRFGAIVARLVKGIL